MSEKILLSHGSGGQLSEQLIRDIFIRHFNNAELNKQGDSAIFQNQTQNSAFTTDSYIIDPIFFPGGDIGKLAVCGTINDLSVAGAYPAYLSAGFIIEEGLEIATLDKIVASMAAEAKNAGVSIVTGDTKVVNKGKADKLFINTAGIGYPEPAYQTMSTGNNIQPGDKIIINGDIGDHGIAVMIARENIYLRIPVKSDCASLNGLIKNMMDTTGKIRFMRDLTRGGLATVLAEIVKQQHFGISITEDAIPVKDEVKSACEMLGLDPLYLANEGKFITIAAPDVADSLCGDMRSHPLGENSHIIGEITGDPPGRVIMETEIGGHKIVNKLSGEQLPRIC